jgi:hypothetical protein
VKQPAVWVNAKKNHRTSDTFGLAQQAIQPFVKPKEPFFANARTDRATIQTLFILKNDTFEK